MSRLESGQPQPAARSSRDLRPVLARSSSLRDPWESARQWAAVAVTSVLTTCPGVGAWGPGEGRRGGVPSEARGLRCGWMLCVCTELSGDPRVVLVVFQVLHLHGLGPVSPCPVFANPSAQHLGLHRRAEGQHQHQLPRSAAAPGH